MGLSVVYVASNAFWSCSSCVPVERSKNLEIIVLRHQLAVLH